jgi:hypothetical protein
MLCQPGFHLFQKPLGVAGGVGSEAFLDGFKLWENPELLT